MLYNSKTFNSFETIGYSCCIMVSIVIGPMWSFTHVVIILDCLGQVLCRFRIWVELPVQRRLCSIFVRNVGSPDIHEYFAG